MIQPGCRAFLEQLSLSGFSVFDATKLSKNTCCLNAIGRAILIKRVIVTLLCTKDCADPTSFHHLCANGSQLSLLAAPLQNLTTHLLSATSLQLSRNEV